MLAQAPDGEGVVVADLDFDRLASVRARLPALEHRRARRLRLAGSGELASVEESMHVAAEQEPVRYEMFPAERVRLDVSRLQHGQGMLAGHRAGPVIRRLHRDAEGALTEPGVTRWGAAGRSV